MSGKQGFKCSVLESWQLIKWIKYIIVEILPPLKWDIIVLTEGSNVSSFKL